MKLSMSAATYVVRPMKYIIKGYTTDSGENYQWFILSDGDVVPETLAGKKFESAEEALGVLEYILKSNKE